MHQSKSGTHLTFVCSVKNRLINPYWPAIICAVLIFGLSISPGIQLPEVGISTDKVGHLIAYGVLAWLIFSGLKKEGRLNKKLAYWVVIGVSLYGIFLEFVQWAFFPYRYFELWDMVANITGTCLSFIIFRSFIIKT